MVASDVGREAIIRNARAPKEAIVVRYKDVRSIVNNFLTNPYQDTEILAAGQRMFAQRANDNSVSAFWRNDADLSLEIIDSAFGMRNDFSPVDFQPAPKKQNNLQIEGVTVSVQLDALVHSGSPASPTIGGAILRLSKADDNETVSAAEKRREMGIYCAVLACLHVDAHFNGYEGRVPAPNSSMAIDLRSGEIHRAPRQFARRRQNLFAACRTISALWDAA